SAPPTSIIGTVPRRSECRRRVLTRALLLIAVTACGGQTAPSPIASTDWKTTGGDPGNSRYSALDQINRGNVGSLHVAWIYHTGDAPAGNSQIQATPIVVNGVLYTTTPALAVVALRADSGKLIWRFDPFRNRNRESHANRGVVYWAAGI